MSLRAVVGRVALIPLGLILSALAIELLLQVGALVVSATGSDLEKAWRTDDRRVLCLGDSNTYGVWLKERTRDSYPGQLETLWNQGDQPPIEVMNLGYPGSNSSRVRSNLSEMLVAFAPEFVIVMVGVNDYWTVPVELPTDPERSGWTHFIEQHSRLHKMIFLLARRTQTDVLQIEQPDDHDPNGEHATARFGEHVFDVSWERATPGELPPIELASNLRSIVEVTRDSGAQIVLMTYPSRHRLYQRANRVIRETALATKTPFVDLERGFLQLCPETECPEWLYDDQHPKASGHRVIADKVIETIAQLDL